MTINSSSTKVAVDGYWLKKNSRGMARYVGHLCTSVSNHVIVDPDMIENRLLRRLCWRINPLWELIALPIMARKARATHLICCYNTPPLIKPKSLRLTLVIHDIIYVQNILDRRFLPHLPSEGLTCIYRAFFLIVGFRCVDDYIFVSDSTLHAFHGSFPSQSRKHFTVIKNNVSPTLIPSSETTSRKLQSYLTVTGAAYSKNFEYLLREFKFHTETYKNSHLTVVGIGKAQRKSKALLAKYGLQDNVTILDRIEDDELRELYASCSALLFCSLREGFGIPIVEALSNGADVICSDIPVFHEVGGKYCIYFDPLINGELHAALDQHSMNFKGLSNCPDEKRAYVRRVYS